MHTDAKERKISATGGKDKTAVTRILEDCKGDRHPRFLITMTPNRKTFALTSCDGRDEFRHRAVDHAIHYASRITAEGVA